VCDDEIVKLYWDRSETAVSATAAKYSKYCLYVASNILHNDKDAEECVNDAYLRAWDAIPPARPAKLSAFLGKITRNLAFNRLEKQRAQKRNFGQILASLTELEECLPDTTATMEKLDDSQMITRTLNVFLEGLSIMPRKVFVRRYWYLSSIDEIAQDYSLSVSNVKSILFRTRKELKKELEKEGILL
jgi:RNA polymerase sigma-70 factor (ECF subfamily)